MGYGPQARPLDPSVLTKRVVPEFGWWAGVDVLSFPEIINQPDFAHASRTASPSSINISSERKSPHVVSVRRKTNIFYFG
jgi:hypothetical protein